MYYIEYIFLSYFRCNKIHKIIWRLILTYTIEKARLENVFSAIHGDKQSNFNVS